VEGGELVSELIDHLRKLGACQSGIDFAEGKTAAEVWTTCVRPGWLGWWLARTNTEPENRRLLRLYCRIWSEDITPRLPEAEREPFVAMLAACDAWAENPTEENRKKARARDLAIARALDLAIARDLASALDLAIALALASARDLAIDLARSLDLALDKKWCDAIRAEFECPFKEAQ
jgi:hypothetical protein